MVPVGVVIRGPTLPKPVVIRGDMGEPPGDRYWDFVATAFPSTGIPTARPSSRPDLGPRFTAVYSDPCCGFRVRQFLYPYARGGPWTYTPAGQHGDLFQMNMTDVVHRPPGGWYRAPALLTELVAGACRGGT